MLIVFTILLVLLVLSSINYLHICPPYLAEDIAMPPCPTEEVPLSLCPADDVIRVHSFAMDITLSPCYTTQLLFWRCSAFLLHLGHCSAFLHCLRYLSASLLHWGNHSSPLLKAKSPHCPSFQPSLSVHSLPLESHSSWDSKTTLDHARCLVGQKSNQDSILCRYQ